MINVSACDEKLENVFDNAHDNVTLISMVKERIHCKSRMCANHERTTFTERKNF